MRPTPIPDEWLACGRRQVIAPPDGDLTNEEIASVEVLIIDADDDSRGIYVRLMPDPGDLEAMAEGLPLWLQLHTNFLPVFSIAVEGH